MSTEHTKKFVQPTLKWELDLGMLQMEKMVKMVELRFLNGLKYLVKLFLTNYVCNLQLGNFGTIKHSGNSFFTQISA